MKKKIMIPIVAIMVMSMAGTAMARGCYQQNSNAGYSNNGPRMIFEQLTPEKQLEVRAIFKKHQKELQTVKTQMWAKRTELNALVNSGKADQKTITKLVKEMTELKTRSYNLRDQLNDEIESATGIVMPTRGCGFNFGGRNYDDSHRMGGRYFDGGSRNGRGHYNENRGFWNSY
ncbi:Spy/CpxP family protein refolding chaperone [Maridesulfovibrio sp.]|uniref:Spy/CpxP family protein refolding chaperone n=1 Tax=Maridesulfovibrio sp. TaxID=2795000 RepID=UPI0039EEA594